MKRMNCIVNVTNVSFCYGDRKVLDNVSFTINNTKDRIAIVGSNGCGKSTLLKLIHTKYTGIDISDKLHIGYFDQHCADMFIDNTLSPLSYITDMFVDKNQQRAHQYLGDLGLASQYHKIPLHQLSGGQLTRVAIARLMVDKPDILLLDEITNHLDIDTCISLISAINNFYGPVILVSHHLDFITSLNCSTVFHLENCTLLPTTIIDYQNYVLSNLHA